MTFRGAALLMPWCWAHLGYLPLGTMCKYLEWEDMLWKLLWESDVLVLTRLAALLEITSSSAVNCPARPSDCRPELLLTASPSCLLPDTREEGSAAGLLCRKNCHFSQVIQDGKGLPRFVSMQSQGSDLSVLLHKTAKRARPTLQPEGSSQLNPRNVISSSLGLSSFHGLLHNQLVSPNLPESPPTFSFSDTVVLPAKLSSITI